MEVLTSVFSIILLTLIIALVASWPAAWLARRMGLVDVPGRQEHKKHIAPTPMGAGIALASSLAAALGLLRWDEGGQLAGILAGAGVVFVFGLIDDRYELGIPFKLLGQCVAAVILILLGIQVSFFNSPAVDLLITVTWVVGIINAINFVDSMDGLALGLGGIAASFFMLAAIASGQLWLAGLAAAILGAALGAFLFNMLPSKNFLGDSGSQMIGFLLAAMGVAYIPLDYEQAASWYVPILVLGVPLFDMALVIISRLRRGRPIYQAGSDHTYHRLRLLHVEPTRSVYVMHLAGLTLGLLAFVGLQSGPVLGNLVLGAVLLTGVSLLWIFERFAPPTH